MEKPIIFNTKMVKAILAGRKTQTRRVIKPQPKGEVTCCEGGYGIRKDCGIVMLQPPYLPGDVLYVRETWAPCATVDSFFDEKNLYVYAANYNEPVPWRWRTPIYMPKAAARIFLLVKDVRVERVQEITEGDALAEGIDWMDDACWDNGWSPTLNDPDSGGEPLLRVGYASLWDSIYAKHDFGWETNPWVWVIEFSEIILKERIL